MCYNIDDFFKLYFLRGGVVIMNLELLKHAKDYIEKMVVSINT